MLRLVPRDQWSVFLNTCAKLGNHGNRGHWISILSSILFVQVFSMKIKETKLAQAKNNSQTIFLVIFSDSYLNSVSILPLVSTWWVCCLYFNVFFSHLNNNFFWNYFAFNLTIQTKCKLTIQHGAHLTAVIPLSIVWVLLWLFSTFGVSFVFSLGKYLTLQVPYHYLSIKLKSGQNHFSFFHLLGVSAQVSLNHE